MKIPSLILKQLYTFGSLQNTATGVIFGLKNRLSDATFTGLKAVEIDEHSIELSRVKLNVDGKEFSPSQITPQTPIEFPLRHVVKVSIDGLTLDRGKHQIAISFQTVKYGSMDLKVKDTISDADPDRVRIPADRENDYSEEIIHQRQRFVENFTGVTLSHINKYSFDPSVTQGNIENFTGVAQVPIGFAGPLKVNGEYAKGEFLIPMATTEGTLVASYNRGIKVLNQSGGVTCSVSVDCMQRAPVFIFDNAREAREFKLWTDRHMNEIREHAEATSSVAKLLFIDTFLSNKFAFLRFNYSTGDAAGQNMVGRATFAACSWILEQHDNIRHFYLESNFATDKKASQVNIMRTRGKRVTAEAIIPRQVLIDIMRVEPESLVYHSQVANVGAFMSGANNNGAHSPNGITAMFIATGQDVANVSESSAGICYAELTPERDLYLSITIPSLIVATHGGGTGLPTQSECLNILGCTGRGSVNRFAEIVAGVALAGEISLGSAISSLDWVSSHEKYGRNR
ncbi:MAG: hydroxymethylglutaryl-CoA reductase [Acidobacteria bacterium]|nr:hydroxymethylglutaryl-CoA reductase [Acidobacteriota bacterium]